MFGGEEDDWSDDFGTASDGNTVSFTPVVGISANPLTKDVDWEDDFDFEFEDETDQNSPNVSSNRFLSPLLKLRTPKHEVNSVGQNITALAKSVLSLLETSAFLRVWSKSDWNDGRKHPTGPHERRSLSPRPRSLSEKSVSFDSSLIQRSPRPTVDYTLSRAKSNDTRSSADTSATDESAIDLAKAAEVHGWKVAFAQGNNNKYEEAAAHFDLAAKYRLAGLPEKALVQLQEALQVAKSEDSEGERDMWWKAKAGDTAPSFECQAYLEMGQIAKAMNDAPKALEHYKKALASVEVVETGSVSAPIHQHLAICASSLNHTLMAANHAAKHLQYLIEAIPQSQGSSASRGDSGGIELLLSPPSNGPVVPILPTGRTEDPVMDWESFCTDCYFIGRGLWELDDCEVSIEFLRKAIIVGGRHDEEIHENATTLLHTILSTAQALNGRSPLNTSTSRRQLMNDDKDNEDDSEEEDWDLEIAREEGLSEAPVAATPLSFHLKAQFMKGSTDGSRPVGELAGGEQSIPERYSLLKRLDTARNLQILKYPPPSRLYSLRTPEGHNFFTETALEKRLNLLMAKHVVGGSFTQNPAPVHRNSVQDALRFVDKLSLEWVETYYTACRTLHSRGNAASCWDVIVDFFDGVKDMSATADEDLDSDDLTNREIVFSLSLDVLSVAAEIWKPEARDKFDEMINIMRTLQVSIRRPDWISLMETTSLAHHANTLPNSNDLKIDSKFCDLYFAERERSKNENVFSTRDSIEESMAFLGTCLAELHLYMIGLSPITLAPRDGDEDVGEELSWNDSDDDGGDNDEESGMRAYCTRNDRLAEDTEYRMKILQEIYPDVPAASFAKCKAAFALSQFADQFLLNREMAEKLAFEALFILDQGQGDIDCGDTFNGSCSAQASILSDFGASVMKLYGEILLSNFKYRYAIALFESVIQSYDIRRKSSHQMYRRLATICYENSDFKRSMGYYEKILDKCMEDERLNEVIYVSEVLSQRCQELGDFNKAEEVLVAASLYVEERASTSLLRIDSLYLNMQLQLSRLLQSSCRLERAVSVLEGLRNVNLPDAKKQAVLLRLARAYAKKRWFKMCDDCINEGLELANRHTPRGEVHAVVSSSTDIHRSDFVLTRDVVAFKEISARNFFGAGNYAAAVREIDEAIHECDIVQLSTLARCYYLRGKFLQEYCSASTSKEFPTTIGSGERTMTVNNAGELVIETVRTYRKASTHFRSTGDDMGVAKTLARLAETYLQHVFVPVSLLKRPLDEMTNLQPIVARLSTLPKSPVTPSRPELAFQSGPITMDDIEQPAVSALEVAVDSSNVMLLMKSYMNMAELRFLQGKPSTAVSYWTECRDLLFKLFMDGPRMYLSQFAPPGFLARVLSILRRLVAMLMAFDSDLINQNIVVIDAFLLFQTDVETSIRRPLDGAIPYDKFAWLDEDKRPKTLGRKAAKDLPEISQSPYSTYRERSSHKKPQRRQRLQSLFDAPTDNNSFNLKDTKGSVVFNLRKSTFNLSSGSNNQDQDDKVKSERVWSCLQRMKVEASRYQKGAISMEELQSRNIHCLRKIRSVNQSASSLDWPFPVLAAKYKGLSKAYFAVHLGDIVVHYIPSSGKKKIQTLQSAVKGRRENMLSALFTKEAANSIYNCVWNALPSPTEEGLEMPSQDVWRKAFVGVTELMESLFTDDGSPSPSSKKGLVMGPKPSFLSSILTPRAKEKTVEYSEIERYTRKGPLILACSRTLQFVPWELMINRSMVRTFSVWTYCQRRKRMLSALEEGRDQSFPHYFCPFAVKEDPRKERRRKERVILDMQKSTKLFAHDSTLVKEIELSSQDLELEALPLSEPESSPLVRLGKTPANYKKKYKYINFFHSTENSSSFLADIESFLPAEDTSGYSVLLMTFVDMIECGDTVQKIMRARPDCVVLFCPASAMKIVARHIVDRIDRMKRQSRSKETNLFEDTMANVQRNPQQFLTTSVAYLRFTANIPVVMLNDPLSEDDRLESQE